MKKGRAIGGPAWNPTEAGGLSRDDHGDVAGFLVTKVLSSGFDHSDDQTWIRS